MSDITVRDASIPQQPFHTSSAGGSPGGRYSLATGVMIAATILIGALWNHAKDQIVQDAMQVKDSSTDDISEDMSSGRVAFCTEPDFPNPTLVNKIKEFAVKVFMAIAAVVIMSLDTLMSIKSGLSLRKPLGAISNSPSPVEVKSSNPTVKEEMVAKKEKLKANIDNFSSKVGGKDKEAISTEVASYLEPGSIKTLKEGCKDTTEAREAFIDFLCELEPKEGVTVSDIIDKPPIEIKKLLGSRGLKLYNAAKKEELNSASFREAVFVKSASKAGAEVGKAVIAPIVGPSSAGKSTVRTLMVEQLFPGEGSANKIVDIDGSNERELSQVSNLLLKYANRQGYQSIDGLHEQSCDGAKTVKSRIEKATKDQTDISLVIPLTFAAVGGPQSEQFAAAGTGGPLGDITKFSDLALETGRGLALAEVVGEEGEDPSTFQNAVVVMGRKRAEAPLGAETQPIDSEVKGSESKKYNPDYFENGKAGSAGARIAYERKVERKGIPPEDSKIFTVYNNLGAYKKVGEDWVKVADVPDASRHSNDAVLINSKQMAIWEARASLPDKVLPEQKKELADLRANNDLAGFAKACNKYGVASGFEIKRTR